MMIIAQARACIQVNKEASLPTQHLPPPLPRNRAAHLPHKSTLDLPQSQLHNLVCHLNYYTAAATPEMLFRLKYTNAMAAN